MEPKRTVAEGGLQRPLPAYFYRLSGHAQRTYLKSDAIDKFAFASNQQSMELASHLMRELEAGAVAEVTQVSRALAAEVCRLTRVPNIRIDVRGVRPHNARGELHGIFYPTRPPLIVLWMRTAKLHDIVKPKTFLRTLLHEIAHYLDYALLRLDDSFHTGGFFKRESFLVRALYPSPQDEQAPSMEQPHLNWDKES